MVGPGPKSSHPSAKPVFLICFALNRSLRFDIRIKVCGWGKGGGLGTKEQRGTSALRGYLYLVWREESPGPGGLSGLLSSAAPGRGGLGTFPMADESEG